MAYNWRERARPLIEHAHDDLDVAVLAGGKRCYYCDKRVSHAPDCPKSGVDSIELELDEACDRVNWKRTIEGCGESGHLSGMELAMAGMP